MLSLELQREEMDNEFIDKETVDKREAVKEKKAKKKSERKTSRAWMQILNGDFLTKEFILNNLPFIFFLFFLLLLMVGKGYYGKQLSSDVEKTQKELDELTAEFVEAKARLEEETRRDVLVEKLDQEGLKETVNPTKVIRLKKDNE